MTDEEILEYCLDINIKQYYENEVAIRVIAALKEMNTFNLSSEDSGLKNTWEEICYQVQNEYSFEWAFYELTINDIIVKKLLKECDKAVNHLLESDDRISEAVYVPNYVIKGISDLVLKTASDYKLEEID